MSYPPLFHRTFWAILFISTWKWVGNIYSTRTSLNNGSTSNKTCQSRKTTYRWVIAVTDIFPNKNAKELKTKGSYPLLRNNKQVKNKRKGTSFTTTRDVLTLFAREKEPLFSTSFLEFSIEVGTHEGTSPCDWSLKQVAGTSPIVWTSHFCHKI